MLKNVNNHNGADSQKTNNQGSSFSSSLKEHLPSSIYKFLGSIPSNTHTYMKKVICFYYILKTIQIY